MLHHFHGGEHPQGQGSISAEQFEQLLDYRAEQHPLLGAHEWFDRAIAGTLRNEVCLSFDDGLACQFDIALPVLKRRGLDAFWFCYSSVLEGKMEGIEVYRHFRSTQFDHTDDFYRAFLAMLKTAPELAQEVNSAIEQFDASQYLTQYPFFSEGDKIFRFVRDRVLGPKRYHDLMGKMIAQTDYSVRSEALWMGAEKIKQLEDWGHIIGLHSHTHPTDLASLPLGDQRDEYQKNMNMLQEILKNPIQSMSHPCSSYVDSTLDILRELGMLVGFRATMDFPDWSGLEYPRIDHSILMIQMNQ